MANNNNNNNNKMNSGMEGLIPIVNKLHDVFTQMGPDVQFDLPQIAVVGGQSAGKSSVLENFVGRDFLPRGTGIVTRRPLILQLINSSQEWGEFLHSKGNKFYKFEDIRTEIEADTDRITGTNKGISNLPINLRIYSPHVLNITLIDLPGLTRNPIGDQPEDIEIQIHDMILEYISKETCLILAVTPANIDLGTSDALKLARHVDPNGLRTIGVITKLDIMDEGTDASLILENKCLPLKRGYVGIVNRSQKDIDGQKDIKAAIEDEKKFFQTHPSYKHMANKMGTTYLQNVLNEQLTTHIRECLPTLRSKLRKEQIILGKEIEKHHMDDPSFKTKAMHRMIHELQSDFRGTMRGYGNVDTNELSGGVKINYLFHENFSNDLARLTAINEEKLRREISFAVRNSHGIEIGIFTPNMAFQVIVKKQISRLKKPTLKCVDLVTEEFLKTLMGCIEKMKNYPRLYEEISFIISTYIQQRNQACKDILIQLIESEASYINSKHEEFIGCASKQVQQNYPNKMIKIGNELSNKGNNIIKKGYLNILNTGIIKGGTSRSHWFVLTNETLTWYKDDNETDKKYELSLIGLNIRDEIPGLLQRRNINAFVLFNPDGKNVTKEFKTLVLSTTDGNNVHDDIESWKICFYKAGVYQDNFVFVDDISIHESIVNVDALKSNTDYTSFSDPQLERQVETIRLLVDSYMNIVTRTSRDLVPKIIMNFIIKKTQDFIDEELLAQIHSQDLESIMAESHEELIRRENILKTYQACKESLQIINEINLATSISNPPPRDNTIFKLKNSLNKNSIEINNSTIGVKKTTTSDIRSKEFLPSGNRVGASPPSIPKRPIIINSNQHQQQRTNSPNENEL